MVGFHKYKDIFQVGVEIHADWFYYEIPLPWFGFNSTS
jgi:hypothetical protein